MLVVGARSTSGGRVGMQKIRGLSEAYTQTPFQWGRNETEKFKISTDQKRGGVRVDPKYLEE